MVDKCFIVIGSFVTNCGDRGSREETWPIKVFFNKFAAQELVDKLTLEKPIYDYDYVECEVEFSE